MKRLIILLLFTCACFYSQAQVSFITTIAGDGIAGYNGDGILAVNSEINNSEGLCFDNLGNLYIADGSNNRVRKINLTTGIITTIAGNGIGGYLGDGALALNAELFIPSDVFMDTAGNIYIADAGNMRIRKVTISTGIITTVAGNGTMGSSGDGGPATNGELYAPIAVCLDNFGNLYIADNGNNKVRKVDFSTGVIATIAGTGIAGYSGDGGLAINAELNWPAQLCTDNSGNVYFADINNHAVRKIDASTAIITSIAGNGNAGYSGNGGPAVNAVLNQPYGIYIDKQKNIYFTEYGNGVIRRIDGVTGIITLVAGDGTPGFSGDGGPCVDAQLVPEGVCFDSIGNMYIADYSNNRVRMVYSPLGIKSPAPKGKISLFPNPVNDELNVLGITENTNYRMLSVSGFCFLQGILEQSSNTILMKDFVPGIYILELTDGNGERNMVRVVKE